MNDSMIVTGYQIAIYEKTGMIKYETKICQGYQFLGEDYLLGLNFELKSHKIVDFMKLLQWFSGQLGIKKNKRKKEKIFFFGGSRYQTKQ